MDFCQMCAMPRHTCLPSIFHGHFCSNQCPQACVNTLHIVTLLHQKKWDIDCHVEIHMCAQNSLEAMNLLRVCPFLMIASAVTMEHLHHLTGWLGQCSL